MASLSEALHPNRETIARDEEFAALRRALERVGGFGLYFARCNPPAYRRAIAEVLRGELDRPVTDVDLTEMDRASTRPSIDYVLEQNLEDAPEDAVVFVWGLEKLLPSADSDAAITRQTLTEINWRRSAFARLGHPLVVWLPEYALRFVARNAPDFFDWNSGVYVFETPDSMRNALYAAVDDYIGADNVDSLSDVERRYRDADVRALIDELTADGAEETQRRLFLQLERLKLTSTPEDARSLAGSIGNAFSTVEDNTVKATGLLIRGMTTHAADDFRGAETLFAQALGLLSDDSMGNKLKARVEFYLGDTLRHLGDYDRARDHLIRSLQYPHSLIIRTFIVSQLSRIALSGYQRLDDGLMLGAYAAFLESAYNQGHLFQDALYELCSALEIPEDGIEKLISIDAEPSDESLERLIRETFPDASFESIGPLSSENEEAST